MLAVCILVRLANAESAGPLDRGISTCYVRHMKTALPVVSAISALAALVGAVSGVWATITSSRNSKSITYLTGRVEHFTGRVDALQALFAAHLKQPQRS